MMKVYHHTIGKGMWIGDVGIRWTQRQLARDENYFIFLPIPPRAPESDEEKEQRKKLETASIRKLAVAHIAPMESQVAFNRGDFAMHASTISEEFTTNLPDEWSFLRHWSKQVLDDLETVRVETILLRVDADGNGKLVPAEIRFAVREGEKFRVVYLQGGECVACIDSPIKAVEAIYRAF